MTKSQIPNGMRRCGRQVCLGIWVLGFGILLISASGCAKARAASVPDGPPLQVPEPPQRVLAPVDPPVMAAPTPESEAPAAPAAAAPRPPARTAERPQPAPPASDPAPAPAPAADTRQLRTTTPANAANEKSIRDLLARAARDVARVNVSRLSADGRTQYEQSKRFSVQAEQALKEKNFVFAATLADKAATLAAELVGR